MPQRKFEKRVYKTKDGKEIEYEVYFAESRRTPAIEEGECLRLALAAGCHDIKVSKPIQAFEDNMFYMGSQQTKFGIPTIPYGENKGKPNPNYTPKSMRFIAYASCVGPDGNTYEDLASAAPDNVEMLKCYLPEMAIKRARVRALILALGLKGLNADVEFADEDKSLVAQQPKETSADILEKKVAYKKRIKELFDELGIKNTKADNIKKKNLIKECFGEDVAPNEMSIPQYQRFVTFLSSKASRKTGVSNNNG